MEEMALNKMDTKATIKCGLSININLKNIFQQAMENMVAKIEKGSQGDDYY